MSNELMTIENLRLRLDAKLITDSGSDTSSASGATTVTFNKTFADVISISVTPNAEADQALTAVYDFDDVANPTSFDVYIYNISGVKVAKKFSWTARGILGA